MVGPEPTQVTINADATIVINVDGFMATSSNAYSAVGISLFTPLNNQALITYRKWRPQKEQKTSNGFKRPPPNYFRSTNLHYST